MIISPLNSIRFRPVDGNLPNYTNTFVADEKFWNDNIFNFCQKFPNTITQKVQIKSDSDTVPTVIATRADKTQEILTAIEVSSYDTNSDGNIDTYYFEFTVDFSILLQETYIEVTQDAEEWKSEPIIGDVEIIGRVLNGEVYKWEYFNVDNAFQLDFSTGITFEVYIESAFKKYSPQGEKTTYDNQRELTILKATKQRTLEFRTLEMPRYLAELIDLITGVDNLTINDTAYVYEDDSIEVDEVEGSNFVTASVIFVDKEYLGINSSDIGFNCDVAPTDAEMSILTILAASGGETFTIPAGYLVHTLRAKWVSGASVEIKLGESVGTDELVYPFNISSTFIKSTVAIHGDIDRDSDTDIYATVTGGVAILDLQLIQNKETGT